MSIYVVFIVRAIDIALDLSVREIAWNFALGRHEYFTSICYRKPVGRARAWRPARGRSILREYWMSAGQTRPINDEHIQRASHGLRPAITMQPTIKGEAGEPIGIVVAETDCIENEGNDLFAGLGSFIRTGLPAHKSPTDIALERLLRKLCVKGRKLGADAILSINIELLHGGWAAGHQVLKMTATGTAVLLPLDRIDQ